MMRLALVLNVHPLRLWSVRIRSDAVNEQFAAWMWLFLCIRDSSR